MTEGGGGGGGWRGRKGEGNRITQRKPLTTSVRKCHILNPVSLSPSRDSNPHSSIGGRLGKQARSPLHHAPPLFRRVTLYLSLYFHHECAVNPMKIRSELTFIKCIHVSYDLYFLILLALLVVCGGLSFLSFPFASSSSSPYYSFPSSPPLFTHKRGDESS